MLRVIIFFLSTRHIATQVDNNYDSCNQSLVLSKEFHAKAAIQLEKIKLQFRPGQAGTEHRVERVKRDGYGNTKTVVRCKNSYTGLFSFLAVPLLLGDIMLDFMSMIDIMIMIMTPEEEPPEPEEPGEPSGNNNNNNNNNNNGGEGGGEGGEGGEGGNNNNNMNMNGRSLEPPYRRWRRESWEDIYQNVSSDFISEKMPSFLTSYLTPTPGSGVAKLPRSGDWTDSADFTQDIRGPFSGVLGWNNNKNILARKLKSYVHNKRW